MNASYIKLGIAALLPVILSTFLYIIDKKTKFKSLNKIAKQIIYGICFGILAIIGTEWGIPMNDAQVNCRDGAVLSAGLLFGGTAGVIAGIIGGVERWISVAWGVGSFTRVACSLSTILAGIYSALLRKYMFDDKRPGWLITFAIGVVMEVFHMTMVFITNMSTPNEAMAVVAACTIPMVIANGLSVMLSTVIITFLLTENRKNESNEKKQARISQTIQRWLLITVFLAFATTSYFAFQVQNKIALTQEDRLLNLALNEVEADIRDMSNANLLGLANIVAEKTETNDINDIAKEYEISEINIVNNKGIIVKSTNPDFIGYNMASGAQSAEFMCLLKNKDEYVQKYGPISANENISRKYAGIRTKDGFVQVGYDAIQFQKDIDFDILGITKNRHVGQKGYILIVDEIYNLVSAPTWFARMTIKDEVLKADMPEENVTFISTVSGEKCSIRYRLVEGYYIISILPKSEVMQTRNVALCVNAFMQILIFAIMFALIYMLIKKVVVNQIKSINKSLAKITGGDLSEVVNVRSNEEFSSLSDDINMTVDTLKHYIDEASARIDAELEFAKNIQTSALPNVFPAFPKRKDFDIYASMNPAKEIGGDFYDFYMTDADVLNFIIADVSGKGIPAAMFMMRAKTEIKSRTDAEMPLSEVFTQSNNALCEGNDAGMFVTAWQGRIDLKNGILQYANAGHNPPLIKHADGSFEFIKTRAGFVLAGMEGIKYKTQEIQLIPGDIIYVYTDGVTEATNINNELYGEERLLTALNSAEYNDMQELCKYIKADVDKFVAEAPQFDDITMVAFKYEGKPPVPSIYFEKCAISDISPLTEFVEAELEKIDCPMKVVIQINVAIDEIYSNIVKYGYKNNGGPVEVKVIFSEETKCVYVRFEDEGIPYNPLTRDDPDVTLSAEERSIGGLGIFMVKKTMDDIKYKYEDNKNILTIKKKII